jgi:TonB family protein
MVTANQFHIIESDSSKKWLKYLAASMLLNILIASNMNLRTLPETLNLVNPLNVNLSSFLAPSFQNEKKQEKKKLLTRKIEQDLIASKQITNQINLDETAQESKKEQLITAENPSNLASQNKGKDQSEVIHPAKYRYQTPPIYPKRAVEMGLEGEVDLHVKILKSGHPETLKIAKSSGYSLLDRAAVASVKKWRFEPTNLNGNIVESWVNVPVNFVIKY